MVCQHYGYTGAHGAEVRGQAVDCRLQKFTDCAAPAFVCLLSSSAAARVSRCCWESIWQKSSHSIVTWQRTNGVDADQRTHTHMHSNAGSGDYLFWTHVFWISTRSRRKLLPLRLPERLKSYWPSGSGWNKFSIACQNARKSPAPGPDRQELRGEVAGSWLTDSRTGPVAVSVVHNINF